MPDKYGNNTKKENSKYLEVPMKRDTSGSGYSKPVDISKRVQPNADQNGGFSGKLTKE
jgi:hypothetical protein